METPQLTADEPRVNQIKRVSAGSGITLGGR
jgi:hypothetical protein